MKKLNISLIALAVSLGFSAGAIGQTMYKSDFNAGMDKLKGEYKTAKAGCDSLSGNAKDVCVVDAKGRQKIAKADLEAAYKPGHKTHYTARITKAEAEYDGAKERCDGLADNAKDVCVKEAKAAKTTAKADAKAELKIAAANTTASKKSAAAQSEASSKSADARKDAAEDTLEARYGVAKEKCDTYAGKAKDHCLQQAKEQFGKS